MKQIPDTLYAQTEAPSNIAIVKYWGKKAIQTPINPSISFSLSKAKTITNIQYTHSPNPLTIEFLFESHKKPEFIPKLKTLTERLVNYLPFLKTGNLLVQSSNTFPHSVGIASSASSMASIAKALFEIQIQIKPQFDTSVKQNFISELARLGSGSACRSIINGWALWGKTAEVEESSDQYAIDINNGLHHNFQHLQDTILIIKKGEKKVSSSIGHQLMQQHPYKNGRIDQANKNISNLLTILRSGDFVQFARICEEEAMSLHGLMMSSSPSYTLLEPNSLLTINRIKEFRDKHSLPITFTLDAGPNIHVLYPLSISKRIDSFINEQLKPLCEDEQLIFDSINNIT